ncbi:HNH endonuclease [Leucobacter sp. NPDC015123]|uniref:HNH endonuclease n=1 Tax=Leucobacter sp. NPDC015123 TaxID=3364129 RepID=UPI0036F4A839
MPAGGTIVCLGCGKPWKLKQDDLHHITYDRLGAEEHEDLWPLCRGCHTLIHDLLTSTKT